MSPREFTDALTFAMGLPNAQIFGFKDSTGKNHHPLRVLTLCRPYNNTVVSVQVSGGVAGGYGRQHDDGGRFCGGHVEHGGDHA